MSEYSDSQPTRLSRPATSGTLTRLSEALTTYGPVVAGYAIPFLLVFYVALKRGGYDSVVRDEIGFLVWWAVLLGGLASILPRYQLPRTAWAGLGLLLAFGLWTATGLSWTESVERTVNETARVATLLGVLGLGLAIQGRDSARQMVSGVAAAIALIGFIALLPRLGVGLLSTFDSDSLLPANSYRLSQPLGYWNGLGALMAIGLPLSTWAACHGRSVAFRAVMAASIPAMAATLYFTFSRAGVGAALVGMTVLFLLYPRRLELIVKSAPAFLGAAIVVLAASRRDDLAEAFNSSAVSGQAGELLSIVIIVMLGVGLVQVSLALAERYGIGPRVRVPRSAAVILAVVLVAAAGVAAFAGNAPDRVDSAWQTFKTQGGPGDGQDRFNSASGNSRYQYWQATLDAHETKPLTGRGPGTFEYWWSRNATVDGFVRNAHSFYLQQLAETGTVGLILISALFILILVTGALLSLGRGSPKRRGLLAAATAGFAAFAVGAAVDWSWDLTVLPVAALLLAAAILGPDARSRHRRESRFRPIRNRIPVMAAIVVISVPCLALLTVNFTSAQLVNRSQSESERGDTAAALDSARAAVKIQPYSASPRLQEALVLGAEGRYGAALAAARQATEREPTNWRTWFVRMAMAAHVGRADEAVRAYRQAARLNHRSRLFESSVPPQGSGG